jgi:hypothetical protein
MCDVTAKGASERLADFTIFNIAGKFIYSYFKDEEQSPAYNFKSKHNKSKKIIS